MTDESPTDAGNEFAPEENSELEATPGEDQGTAPEVAAEPEPLTSISHGATATVAGRVWVAIGVAFVVLVLLIIFIAENSGKVTVSFLGAHGTLSLGLAMLIAAVAGVAITLLVGTARILQLRREVRRTSRE